ncbi:GNAT family N-acetyltransferase [Brachybacterium sp. YJGR34]|uniref:GNAT family N-acetyltransferase n=1 Tax=Brachybacterium sp. YJGR34 TaxID=2059911 RepID=UPI000E0A7040|nr:GNAT family N-acetyltransferase [Brachybacterium sp. YJGR34]
MDETSADQGAVRLVHDDDRDRFEALRGEEVVAVLGYGDEESAVAGGATVRDLRSTVVAPEHSGRGIGSAIVRFALEDARTRGLQVTATCWFARGWLERHREYADLLAPGRAGSDDGPAEGPTKETR